MICGIDIGLSGGICMLENEHTYSLFYMPVYSIKMEKNKKNNVNIEDLFNILDSHKLDMIVIEDIKSIFGVSKATMLSLGKQIGYIQAYSIFRNVPLYLVPPKTWQAHFLNNVPKMNIEGNYKETFYKSLSFLHTILPSERINIDFKIKKRYIDGFVDAYIIALYGYKKLKQWK